MPLEAKRRLVGAGQALQRAVEQTDVGGAQIGRQTFFIHSKTVVLTGDADTAGVQVFHRVVRTVVAKLHFERFGTTGQRHDLVAQTDPEGRNTGFNQLTR